MQRGHIALPVTLTATESSLFGALLLVDSLHFVFARALLPYFDPVFSASMVLLVAAVQVGVYGVARGKLSRRSLSTRPWLFAAIGFMVAASTALGYSSVAYIDVGTAAMLNKLSTLFSILIGILWLRERLTATQLIGALVAVTGVFIITFQPGDLLRLGSLMLLGSTLLYALHAALVKRYSEDIDFFTFFFLRLVYTASFLLVFAVMRPSGPMPGLYPFGLIILAGTIDVVISRSLYYIALRRLPMTLHAIILTLSPVATVLWSYILFSDLPNFQQLLGGTAVLCGVLLATLYRTRRA
jgi:drug/metabolite transporter (DMT)-like permease